MTVKLNRTARDSGTIYAAALADVCTPRRIDPVRVLTDTDDYPQIVKGVETLEFIVGWFHGVSEALGVHVEILWEAVAPAAPPARAPKPPAKPRRNTGSKPGKAPAKPPAKPRRQKAPPARKPRGAGAARAVSAALQREPSADASTKARAVLAALRERRAS